MTARHLFDSMVAHTSSIPQNVHFPLYLLSDTCEEQSASNTQIYVRDVRMILVPLSDLIYA